MLLDNPALWLFAAIAAPCAFLAVRYWQRALFGVFVLLVFEGALRKWAFPWAQAQIYLLKDLVLLAAYIGFLLDGQRNQPALRDAGLIKIILITSFAFGCIEVFNPNSPSILVGLLGLKTYFLYAPVAFILPYAFKSREQLFDLTRRYLIMAIPVAVLGFVQIAAGPESSLNAYVSQSEDAEVAGVRFGRAYDLVRTSGTFSYISGYATFLSFVAFLAIGYNMAQGWRLKKNIAPVMALALVVGAMFTTGSRGPVYSLVATGPIILVMAVAGRVLAFQTAMRVTILLPVIAIVALNLSPRAVEGFSDRATSSSDTATTRLSMAVDQTIGALAEAPVLGNGIGTTHNQAVAVMGTDDAWWLHGLITEEEPARVTVELGIIGLLLMYSLRLAIAAFAVRCAMSFKDPAYRALGIALSAHLVLSVILHVINNLTASLYYWGALGLVLTMRRLERCARTEVGTILSASQPRFSRSANPGRARAGIP
jgi:hypothetical protein